MSACAVGIRSRIDSMVNSAGGAWCGRLHGCGANHCVLAGSDVAQPGASRVKGYQGRLRAIQKPISRTAQNQGDDIILAAGLR